MARKIRKKKKAASERMHEMPDGHMMKDSEMEKMEYTKGMMSKGVGAKQRRKSMRGKK